MKYTNYSDQFQFQLLFSKKYSIPIPILGLKIISIPIGINYFNSQFHVELNPTLSLMPSTTIENLSRLWPLFFPPVDNVLCVCDRCV